MIAASQPMRTAKCFIYFSAIFIFLLIFTPNLASAKTLRAITGFPQTHLFTEGCLGTFLENLSEISAGKLKLNVSGPDVVPTNEQFQPLQAGVFDLLYTHAAYHLGVTAMGAAIEAVDPDPVKRRKSGIIDYVDQKYHKLGVKLVAVFPMVEYNIVLRNPIGERNPSLQGEKIRTAALVAPAVKALGGAPVNMPPGEIYTAMQKGVIDGFTLVAVGLEDYKAYEVAKYLARPMFGFISSYLFMNLNTYNRLTEEEQQWIKAAAIQSEKDSLALFRKKHQAEVQSLKEKGMQETRLQPEDARKIGKVFTDTIWAVAEKKSGSDVVKLRELAIEKGMTQ